MSNTLRRFRRHQRVAFWAVILVVWGLDTHGNWAGTGDEPHYAMIAHSLVFDGDFDLGNDYRAPGNLVPRGTLDPGNHVRAGKDGVTRPVHDVGLPIVAAPYFAIAYRATQVVARLVPQRVLARARLDPPLVLRHLLSLGMIILTGLMARKLYRVLAEGTAGTTAALGWTLLFVLSPPLLSHSFLFFTEIPAAAIVTWSFAAIRTNARAEQRTLRSRDLLLLGAGVGFLPLLHVRYAGLAAGLGVVHLWQIRRRNVAAGIAFLGPVAGIIAFRTWLNIRFWGTLVSTPHVRLGEAWAAPWTTLVSASTRLLGLCFDQAHGLLVYAPIYLVALPGIILLGRVSRRESRAILLVLCSYLVPLSLPALNAHGWAGGWAPAARFLVPVVPLLILAGFAYVERLESWPAVLKILVALQVAVDAICWSHPKILWNDTGSPSALLRFVSPRGLDLSRWLPAWEAPSTYTILVSLSVLALWAGASLLAVRNLEPHLCRRGTAVPIGE